MQVQSHHGNPNMNPPRRQKHKHHRPLRREHIRILLLILRRALLRTQRPAIIDRLSRGRGACRIDEALRVRGWPELVWLGENARSVCDLLASCGCGASLGEAAAAGWDAQGIAGVVGLLEGAEGAEGSGCGEASGEEEGWDWGWRHGG